MAAKRPNESPKSPTHGALERNRLAPDVPPSLLHNVPPTTQLQPPDGTNPALSGNLGPTTNDPRTAPRKGNPGPM